MPIKYSLEQDEHLSLKQREQLLRYIRYHHTTQLESYYERVENIDPSKCGGC